MKSIILDTESNGMRPFQLCQLSYIIAENGHMSGRNFFFPVTCMNEHAKRKHGFSKFRLYELSKGRSFEEQLPEFEEDFATADLICGHNIAADVRVMRIAYEAAGALWPKPREFCTMAHFDNAMHLKSRTGAHKPPNLGELCGYFRLTDEEISEYCERMFGKHAYHAHDARYDTAATCLCIERAEERGDLRGVI